MNTEINWASAALKGLLYIVFFLTIAFLVLKNSRRTIRQNLWLLGVSFMALPLAGLVLVAITNSYSKIEPREFAWTFVIAFLVFGLANILYARDASTFKIANTKRNIVIGLSNTVRLTENQYRIAGYMALGMSALILLAIVFDW